MAIANCVTKTLNKFGLDVSKISAFGADNMNANFERTRSCYTILKGKNAKLIKSGCVAQC